jgi:hypothetical protein
LLQIAARFGPVAKKLESLKLFVRGRLDAALSKEPGGSPASHPVDEKYASPSHGKRDTALASSPDRCFQIRDGEQTDIIRISYSSATERFPLFTVVQPGTLQR